MQQFINFRQFPVHKQTIFGILIGLPTVLLLCALLLCHLDHDAARDIWTLTAPGLTITGLRDTRTGPVLWVTAGGEFQGRWAEGRWEPAEPTPYPTATPYPTSTPYPTPTRGIPLQEA